MRSVSLSTTNSVNIWNKSYITFVSPKNFNNSLLNNRIEIAKILGFDISKNRVQGAKYTTISDLYNYIDINYKTYSTDEIQKGIEIYTKHGKLTSYISIKKALIDHFNSQSQKNKNRKIKKYIPFVEDKLNKELWKLNKVCAFNRFYLTDIIVIDIDSHTSEDKNKAIKAFEYICTNYYDNIIYAEMSQNNGYHIFIKVNEYLDQDKLKQFQQHFKDLNFDNVEIIGANNEKQLLQYIDSPQYHPIQLDRNGYISLISESIYTDFIIKFKLSSTLQAVNDLCKIRLPRKIKNLKQIEENKNISIFGNRKNTKHKFKSKENIIENLKIKYPYGAGQRVERMKTIASACFFYGLNEKEFVEICLANNHGSKDLKKWSMSTIERIYYKYYSDFCIIIGQTNTNSFKFQTESFISNQYLLDSNQFLKIRVNEFSNIFSSQILSTLKYTKWKSEYQRIIPILINEIIGSFIYDSLYPKLKNKQSTITTKKFNSISKSFSITPKWKKLFKQQYSCKIDINKLINIIMNNTIFKQLLLNSSGYCFNPKYAYCKLWNLKDNRNNNIIKSIIKNIILYIQYYNNKIRDNMCKFVIQDFKEMIEWHTKKIENFQYG